VSRPEKFFEMPQGTGFWPVSLRHGASRPRGARAHRATVAMRTDTLPAASIETDITPFTRSPEGRGCSLRLLSLMSRLARPSERLRLSIARMGLGPPGGRGAHRARRTPHPAKVELLLLREHQAGRSARAFDSGAARHRALEARAKSRLRALEGLWRKPVLGRCGVTPRPGTSPSSSGNAASSPF